ncbi:MAG: 50S ribosomal protein L19 [Clostridia bacterium]|nr:50S ribosomal protein L19 [Clostridia bacterium]
MNNIIDTLEKEGIRTDLPKLEIGDHVKVYFKIIEGNKERLQAYEGTVIAKKNGSIRETVTVRRISYGIGVEKTFPVNSPKIGSIEVIGHGQNRRAKLYYLRNRTGKAAKLKKI